MEDMNEQRDTKQWEGSNVGKLDLTTAIVGLTELSDNEEKVH